MDLNTILAHSCGNPTDWEAYVGAGQNPRDYSGFYTYRIETHCTAFVITARSNGDGTFEVAGYETEDC